MDALYQQIQTQANRLVVNVSKRTFLTTTPFGIC